MNAFLERYIDRITPEPNSGCLLWTGAWTLAGYGRIGDADYAHRLSFESSNGVGSADGFLVRHKCDTPPCVNPNHLLRGTTQDNCDDMYARGRQRPAKGIDSGGAKLTEETALEIRRRSSLGENSVKLADRYGITHQGIRDIVIGVVWKHLPGAMAPTGHLAGSRLTQSKLTESSVREIKERLRRGETHKAIAPLFGVKHGAISMIATGRNWKHVL